MAERAREACKVDRERVAAMLRADGTGGSDMFTTYSGEFDDYREQITHAIADYGVAEDAKRGALSRKILQDIDELGDIIKQMELEVRSHQGPARQTLNERLVEFRKSRQEVQKAWRIAKEKADAGNRGKLLSGARSAGAGEGVYAQTNTRESEMDSLLAKTSDRLSETRRTLADTERVGGAVLSDLDGQRRKLEASRDKLHQADENIGMAMQVMRRMKNRATRNKVSLVLMLAMLVGVIALMIYELLTRE